MNLGSNQVGGSCNIFRRGGVLLTIWELHLESSSSMAADCRRRQPKWSVEGRLLVSLQQRLQQRIPELNFE